MRGLRLFPMFIGYGLASATASVAAPLPFDADVVLVGRVVSVRDIVLMEGDVAVTARAFVFETGGASTRRIEFVGSAACLPTSPSNETYVVFLSKKRFVIGVLNGQSERDYAGIKDLVVTACTPVSPDRSVGFR